MSVACKKNVLLPTNQNIQDQVQMNLLGSLKTGPADHFVSITPNLISF